MQEIYPNRIIEPDASVGEGWPFFCSRCAQSRVSLAPGLCPSCSEPIATGSPSVRGPPSGELFWKSGGPASLPPSTSHVEILLIGATLVGIVILLLQLFGVWGLPAVFLTLLLVGISLSDQEDLLLPFEAALMQPDFFAVVSTETARRAGRLDILVHVHCQASIPKGNSLEMVVRLRGPDGHYLRASQPLYAGEHDELRLWQMLPHDDATGETEAVVSIPVSTLSLPTSWTPHSLRAEILFAIDGSCFAEQEAEILVELPPGTRFGPASERRSLASHSVELLPEQLHGPPTAGEVTTMLVSHEHFPAGCLCSVCGEGLRPEPVLVCRRCETPHHRTCWSFSGGCATAGCVPERKPVRA